MDIHTYSDGGTNNQKRNTFFELQSFIRECADLSGGKYQGADSVYVLVKANIGGLEVKSSLYEIFEDDINVN